MKNSKRQKLEAAGWKVGTPADFLGLSKEEESLIDMKLALANKLKARRQKRNLTQLEIAKRLGSSQSRVAKMEVADRSVSLDLLVRSLLSLGETRQDIAGTIGKRSRKKKSIRPTAKKHSGGDLMTCQSSTVNRTAEKRPLHPTCR
jgi:hypothetical protein